MTKVKLYTEKQIRSMLNSMGRFIDEQVDDYIDSLTTIELPSDEEIEQENPYVTNDEIIDFWAYKDGFVAGAKWMREQIQVGNK